MFTFDDFDEVKACEKPHDMEFIDDSGNPTGFFFKVLGDQSEAVTAGLAALINENRRKEAAKEAAKMLRGKSKTVDFTPIEDDIEFIRKSAMLRLVGWRTKDQTDGLTAEQKERFQPIPYDYSKEAALKLLKNGKSLSRQIMAFSESFLSTTRA